MTAKMTPEVKCQRMTAPRDAKTTPETEESPCRAQNALEFAAHTSGG